MGIVDYIDTRKATIAILKDYRDQKWKLETARERLAELDARLDGLKSSLSNEAPSRSGRNTAEERLCSAIDQKTVAQYGIRKAREYDRDLERGWERLSENERDYLTMRWIDQEEGDGVKKIMEKYHVEKSEAYRRSEDALQRLAKLLFW
jgi:hypothetical protein